MIKIYKKCKWKTPVSALNVMNLILQIINFKNVYFICINWELLLICLNAIKIRFLIQPYCTMFRVQFTDFIITKTYIFRSTDSLDLSAIQISLSVCIPKPCSLEEGISHLVNESTLMKYKEEFCRFKGDKPWSPGIYVAM